MVVTEGTVKKEFEGVGVPTAGKTGTAEYCDEMLPNQKLMSTG